MMRSDRFFFTNRFLLLASVIFFAVLELSVVLSVKYFEKIDKDNFLASKSKELKIQVDMGQHYLNEISELLYNNAFDQKYIAQIMYAAANTYDLQKQAELRSELYEKYKEKYDYIKHFGVRQLHFHLPGAISFLRFHRPDKFGDSLVGIRESLMYVNTHRKPVECFEEGRVFNGFRHVYPIFYQENFVGTVEISYSFKAFLEHMLENNPDASYLFLMNKQLIYNKVFSDEKQNYIASSFDGYSIDKNTLNKHMGMELQELFEINKAIAKTASQQMKQGIDFTVSTWLADLRNKSVIVSFIAVKNFENKTAAYMLSYTKSDTLDLINKRSAQILVLLTFINLIFTVLLALFLRKEKRKTELATKEALHDQLTGILNRRGFDLILHNKAGIAKRYNSPLSIIFFDIDHFKMVNDLYGHDVGDVVLKTLVQIIQENIRQSDLFARWGGEEFAILTPITSAEEAEILAQKLRVKILASEFSHVAKITCSFGVTQYRDAESEEEFVKRADRRLYRAKAIGRDTVVSDSKK